MNSQIISQPVFKSVHTILTIYLDDLKKGRAELTERSHEEALHDTRVASRRLSTWLNLCGDEKILDVTKREKNKIRQVIKLTNGVRDLEVRLSLFQKRVDDCVEKPVSKHIEELRKRWEGKLESGYDSVLRELPDSLAETEIMLGNMLDRLKKSKNKPDLTRNFGEFLLPILGKAAQDLGKSLNKIRHLEDEDEAHKARLRAKKFRYLFEPISKEIEIGPALISDIKQLQDLLGDMRDASLLANRLKKVHKGCADEKDAKEELIPILEENSRDMHRLFKEFESLYLSKEASEYSKEIAALKL